MTQPWLLFICLTLGLIAGGGTAVITAPTHWLTAGMDAPEIITAQQCAVSDLKLRGGL
jgi:hypothetical protein